MNNTKIPVMGHADGICHIYIDKDANKDIAIPVVVDAKTQYSAACNAVETILVHKDIAKTILTDLIKTLQAKGVVVNADSRVVSFVKNEMDEINVNEIADDGFNVEYSRFELGIKIVDSLEDAIKHINKFGSHHTDCIITDNKEAADKFQNMVDSAGVYVNVSTRFADGFRYGFGAEVGISTSKIHARGPVGLEGLVTYKYKLVGNGQIVSDYATGKSKFTHRDI
jgi:glutamate-5-semialdehyde dehydrogenase